jgi:hypothetical protein
MYELPGGEERVTQRPQYPPSRQSLLDVGEGRMIVAVEGRDDVGTS